MSDQIAIADAVIAELVGAGFSEPLNPQRRFRPEYRFEELDALRATVVPAGLSRSGGTRDGAERQVRIDVALQQRLPSNSEDSETRIGELITLIEDVAAHLHRRRFEFPASICTDAELDPVYAPEHLEMHNAFTGVIRLTFRLLNF